MNKWMRTVIGVLLLCLLMSLMGGALAAHDRNENRRYEIYADDVPPQENGGGEEGGKLQITIASGEAQEGSLKSTSGDDAGAPPPDAGAPIAPIAPPAFVEGELYCLYNPNTGEHFYTKNPEERDALSATGWMSDTDNGTSANSSAQAQKAIPVPDNSVATVFPGGSVSIAPMTEEHQQALTDTIQAGDFDGFGPLYIMQSPDENEERTVGAAEAEALRNQGWSQRATNPGTLVSDQIFLNGESGTAFVANSPVDLGITGSAKVDAVALAAGAAGSTLTVESGSSVDTVAVGAAGSSLTVEAGSIVGEVMIGLLLKTTRSLQAPFFPFKNSFVKG